MRGAGTRDLATFTPFEEHDKIPDTKRNEAPHTPLCAVEAGTWGRSNARGAPRPF